MRDRPQPIPEEEIASKPAQKDIESGVVERTDLAELENDTKQKVVDWSRQWLENFYGKEQKQGSYFDDLNFLRQNLAALVGESDSLKQRFYAPNLQTATRIFFEQLVDFIETKGQDLKEKQNLKKFIGRIHESFFSFSPGLEESLSFEDKLLLTAKANRTPEVQGWFGQNLVGELVYDLNWSGPGVESSLSQEILKKNSAEILDIVEQLVAVGARAAGEMYDASGALKRTVNIIRKVRKDNPSPIVAYACALALERLRKEDRSPTLGFVTYHGNKGHARVGKEYSEKIQQDHLRLSGQINPDIDIHDSNFVFIASDAVAVIDHAHTPRFLARINQAELPQKQEVSIVAVRNIVETLKERKDLYMDDVVRLFGFINKRIIGQSEKLEAGDKKSAELWHQITECLSAQEWDAFFKAIQEFDELRERFNQKLYSGEMESYSERDLWNSEIGQKLVEAARPIVEVYGYASQKLVAYLAQLDFFLSQKLQLAHFESYRQIPDDKTLNPFSGTDEKDLSLLLQHLHQPELREKIEKDLGIKLAEIPLRSQIHLLRFLASQDREGFDRLRSVLQKNPENADLILNSFLACAEDSRYSEPILILAEKLDTNTAKAVFDKYAEIVGEAEKVRKYLAESSRLGSIAPEQIDSIIKNLLHRGNELLVNYSKRTAESSEKLLSDLSNIKSEVVLFASIIREMLRNPDFSIDEFVKKSVEIKDSAQLTEDERRVMTEVFKAGRKENNYTEEMQRESLIVFEKLLSESGHEFTILKEEGGNILTFVRVDRISEGQLYVGSFNLRQETRGTPLAAVLARKVLERYGADNDLTADVYEKNPALRYYKMLGFKQVEVIDNYKGRGQRYVKLIRPKSAGPELDKWA